MITLTREEAEQVLEALKTLHAKLSEPTIDGWPLYSGLPTPPDNFIDAIRYNTAISQGGQRIDPTKIYKESEPEPVAYIDVETRKLEWAKPTRWETPTVVNMDKVPLYTAPPQRDEASAKAAEWVGLTDETYWEMWVESPSDVLRFAHAIEAKIKEKNYDKR